MKVIIFIYFVLSVSLLAMPASIEGQIRKSGLDMKDVSIYIKEAGMSGQIVASHRATQLRTPASVCKVLSTYASVLKLGFDYRWPTQFYVSGVLRNGVLNGDLIVKGYGDPTLSRKDLDSIVQNIRAQGIKKITGNIVIDRSYFDVGNKDNSGFDNNLYSPYNAMPDAMMFNERISTVCVTPNKNNASKVGNDGSYTLVNKLQRVNQPCTGRYSWPGVSVNKNTNTPVVSLYGPISRHCGSRNICQVITKPYLSFYYALKEKLEQKGIKVSGTMRLRKVSQNAKILFTHYSKPLEQIISKTAKESNNLYARHLLLTLGAKMYGAPSRLEKGRKAVLEILKKSGALNENIKVDNGSGLSRTAKLTAKSLADTCDHAYSRYGQRWMDTLSVAGVDGTIKRRFAGTVVKNKAWMKTGTVNRVKNIAGYVKNKSGTIYTVVILVETNKGTWKAAKLQDDIIKWLATSTAKPSKKALQETNRRINTQNRATPKEDERVISKEDEKVTPIAIPKEDERVVSNVSSYLQERFYVQSGSFSSQPKKAFLLSIEQLNLPYKVKYSQKYRVLVGPYGQEKDAQKALQKIRTHINPSAFILKL